MGHYDDIREEHDQKRKKAREDAIPMISAPDRRVTIIVDEGPFEFKGRVFKTPDRRRGPSNDRRRHTRRTPF